MPDTSRHVYALALGSNRPLSARRTPAWLLREATTRIGALGTVLDVAPVIQSAPVGPSRRRFTNGALLVDSRLPPPAMLNALQAIERALGRRRFLRWGARSVDIDIILWSGGQWRSRALSLPHPAFAQRDFVLTPLRAIAPEWRAPPHGYSVRQLCARLQKAKPVDAARG